MGGSWIRLGSHRSRAKYGWWRDESRMIMDTINLDVIRTDAMNPGSG